MSSRQLLPRSPGDDERTDARTARARVAGWLGRWQPAWLAGVDLRILNQVPSEWSFYNLLGIAVLGLTCFSGFSATLALGYVLATPALELWWFGILWTCGLLFIVERIVLSVPTTRKRSTFYASLAFRGALSIVIALMLAEPLLLRLNEREVSSQLTVEHRESREQSDATIRAHFNPQISGAREELRQTRAHKKDVQRRAKDERRRHREGLETGTCDARCLKADETSNELRRQAENNDRQPRLRKKIHHISKERDKRIAEEHREIAHDDGFWARIGALSVVVDKHPGMDLELWGLRIGLFLLDLAPLLALVFYLKREAPKPYEELRVAYWHLDALVAKGIRGNTDVREHEISERIKAEREAVQAEIMLEADRRMAEAGLDGTIRGPEGHHHDSMGPVGAPDLSGFVRRMRWWENEPVKVSPAVRRGGIVGSLAIGGLALVTTIWSVVSGHPVRGLWLIVAALCGVAVLAATTHGFRRAPAWALWAIFTTLIVGLTLPILILLINV